MSIILDALKKAQKVNKKEDPNSINASQPEGNAKKLRPKFVVGLVISTFFAIVLLVILLRPRTPPIAKPKTISPESLIEQIKGAEDILSMKDLETEQTQPRPLTSFTLKGVIIGEGENYAIINDKIVGEGQEIEGVTVKQIGDDEVILSRQEEEYLLKISR